jgi:hypothetical protein
MNTANLTGPLSTLLKELVDGKIRGPSAGNEPDAFTAPASRP